MLDELNKKTHHVTQHLQEIGSDKQPSEYYKKRRQLNQGTED